MPCTVCQVVVANCPRCVSSCYSCNTQQFSYSDFDNYSDYSDFNDYYDFDYCDASEWCDSSINCGTAF